MTLEQLLVISGVLFDVNTVGELRCQLLLLLLFSRSSKRRQWACICTLYASSTILHDYTLILFICTRISHVSLWKIVYYFFVSVSSFWKSIMFPCAISCASTTASSRSILRQTHLNASSRTIPRCRALIRRPLHFISISCALAPSRALYRTEMSLWPFHA